MAGLEPSPPYEASAPPEADEAPDEAAPEPESAPAEVRGGGGGAHVVCKHVAVCQHQWYHVGFIVIVIVPLLLLA